MNLASRSRDTRDTCDKLARCAKPFLGSLVVVVGAMAACSGTLPSRGPGVEGLPFSPVGMVLVPGGPYHYDCNEAAYPDCDADEIPGSTRSLPAFHIDQTEVTVAAYRECVSAGACGEQGLEMPYWQYAEQPHWAWACNWSYTDREQHPINCIGFEMASTYCAWRGKRLPTQGEWQKAARGTEGWTYPWGNDASYTQDRLMANIADETYRRYDPLWKIARGYDDGYLTSAPVGSFPHGASPYGALDMAGNVWEWTGGYPIDEEGEEIKDRRWTNGGSFDSRPALTRVTFHYPTRPESRFSNVGMRCAAGG